MWMTIIGFNRTMQYEPKSQAYNVLDAWNLNISM